MDAFYKLPVRHSYVGCQFPGNWSCVCLLDFTWESALCGDSAVQSIPFAGIEKAAYS